MRFKTLEEALKSQNKGQVSSIPSEEFTPKEITEWVAYGDEKLPHKAIAEDGVEVEYFRSGDGGIREVGLKLLDKKGKQRHSKGEPLFKSYFKKVEESRHLSPLNKDLIELEMEDFLTRNWNRMTKGQQLEQEALEQEVYDQQNLTRDDYIEKYQKEE